MRIFALFVPLLLLCSPVQAQLVSSFPNTYGNPLAVPSWINLKAPYGNLAACYGDNSHDDTACVQAHIDYAFANNLTAVYCPAGNYKTSSTIYVDPPGNMRTSGRANPTMFAFSMSFFGDPAAGGVYQGCQIKPTFNNDVAALVGTGQGMRVSDIAVIGPSNGYRAQQNSSGVGIGLSGGNGGSSKNLVENTHVENFYTLYKTSANGNGSLNDQNTFRKITGQNAYIGINFSETQNDINDVVEPELAYTTVGIYSVLGRPVNVWGGNISSINGQNAQFNISGVSAFTKTTDGGGFDYTFTATLASPDQYIGSVYSAYTISTSHFGLIPATMTNWDSGTNVGTFQLYPPWVFANYGIEDLTTTTDMQAEVAAVSTIYAAERTYVAWGSGIVLDGIWVENANACTTLLRDGVGYSGAQTNQISTPYFGADPTAPTGTANVYCARSFPFIAQEASGGPIEIRGGTYGNIGTSQPLLLEIAPLGQISGAQLSGVAAFNIRVPDSGGYAYSQLGGYDQFNTEARGAGDWDNDYFIPRVWMLGFFGAYEQVVNGELKTKYCGYEPCISESPNLSPTIYASVSGSLGALGTYPPIACRTVFPSVEWNSGALAHIHLRSASCPGYSWGQNLTDATVGETVTWSYKGQSDDLYLDTKTLSFMFPGLGFSLDNGGGPVTYTVTGVYPDLGYITVINATSNAGSPLAGTKTTVYSCLTGCTIGQASYAWTAY